jgi:ribonuclease HI
MLHVEAEVPPLQHRRKVQLLRHLAHIKRLEENHPLWKMWSNFKEKVDPEKVLETPIDFFAGPRPSRRRTSIFQAMCVLEHSMNFHTIDHPVERRVNTYLPPPWQQHQFNSEASIHFPRFGSSTTRSSQQSLDAQHYAYTKHKLAIRKIKKGFIVFSDGSVSNRHDGYNGCGIVIQNIPQLTTIEDRHPVNKMLSSFGTELSGIFLALQKIRAFVASNDAFGTDCTGAQGVVLFCDNQEAVTQVNSRIATDGEHYSLIRRIKDHISWLRSKLAVVEVDWIPGHCFHDLQDRADALAKEASQLSSFYFRDLPIKIPYSAAKRQITVRMDAVSQLWWKNTTRGRHLFSFHKEITKKRIEKILEGTPRRLQVCLDRLRMGNETTNSVLVLVGVRQNDNCDLCGVSPDSKAHRILDCQKYQNQRIQLQKNLESIDRNLVLTLDTLLNWRRFPLEKTRRIVKAFTIFLINTELDRLFVWQRVSEIEDPDN